MDGPGIVLVAALVTIGWIVHVIVDGFRRRQQLKVFTEFHSKLLDRLGSAREFGDFFNSEGGGRFLESLASRESGAPQIRILKSLQSGFVLLALGGGLFLLLSWRTLSVEATDGLMVTATVASSIGVGLIASTAMSYLLSKRMGLIEQPRPTRQQDTSPTA